MPTNQQPDLVTEARELLYAINELPPWFVGDDDGNDCPNHARSGLAVVDTGRADDWPIARHCHWPVARFIARAPELIRQLADEVERRDELIVHMYVHSGYRNNGYLQMTTPQKALYDGIWKRSVEELDKEESND